MKPTRLMGCLLAVLLLSATQLNAQMSSTDLQVNINYVAGTMRVDWKDDPGGSNVCREYSTGEKISYRIGANSPQKIFDNTGSGSIATNYREFNNLPGDFFSNPVTIIFESDFGNANTSCGNPLVPTNIQKQIATRIDDPQSPQAGFDVSCDEVPLSWLAPSIVAGASNLRFEVERREANTSGSYTNIYNNTGTSYNDAAAPAGKEQEYRIRTVMHYSATRIAKSPGVIVNGRKIGIAGTPTGLFLDQADCGGAIDVTWNWSNSNNPSNFEVLRATNNAFSANTQTYTISGADRSIRDNNTNVGTEYFYKVRATGACPNRTTPIYSSYTSSESKVGLGAPVATATSSIVIDTTDREVTLTWVDNSKMEEGFKIVRQSATGQVEFDVGENVTTYTDNSADICQNLTYQVKVYNSCRTNGVMSTNSQAAYIPADIANVFNQSQNKVESSDGEFGDRIELKWKTPTRQVDDWYVYRINPLTSDTVFVASVEGKSRFYSDNRANANTLYEYMIQGVSDCAGNTLNSNITKDIGFRLAFGTVNGQVTYDGGTAVKGVKVTAEAASGASGFSGDFNGTSAYANAGNPTAFQSDSMTIVAFIRPQNLTGKKVIASKKSSTSGWELFLDGSTLKLTSGNKTISASSPFIIAGNWASVAGSVSGDTMKLYVNGALLKAEVSNQTALNSTSNLMIGKSGTGDYFKGQLDEVRFYNRAISDLELLQSYDVYVNPSMNSLRGYWRFDEGFGGRAYDYSKTLLTPNKNHADLVGVTFNGSKPSSNQLTAGAYTDERGSYFIPFVPYLGNGDNFILTPSFGTHTFSPATTTLYIGGSTPNFSNVDFTDNSSFNVTGSVKFENSTCFVEDVFIKVDGEVVIQNGEPVRTDEDGLFSLQVPIGPHVLTAEKQGHTFAVGRFPSSGNYNFQQNEALASFIDNTLMKVVGRVAGGGVQEALPPGLGRGTNNIGRATIRFVSQQGGGCFDTTVTTDVNTGEYEIYLPPIKYQVPNFYVTSNNAIGFTNNSILDLSMAPMLQTETDTLFRDSLGVKKIDRIDTIAFNKLLDFIYYETPRLNVVDADFQTVYGSDSLNIEVNDSSMTVPTAALGMKYPIFEENTNYEWNIQAFEIYENRDNPSNPILDSVPISEGKFVINNQLSNSPAAEFEIQPMDEFNGTQLYRFTAGQANTAADQLTPDYSFTKTFELTLITPNSTVSWRPNLGDGTPSPLFRGVIFGGRALGNSFATAGPQVVTMILRDPPGSNSFSSWEEETQHTTVSTFENAGGVGVELQKNFKLGTKFSIGLGYTTETEISNSLLSTTTIESNITGTNEYVETMTNSVAINTSADPEFVGPDADLFFGRSLNMDFGLSQIITLIDIAKCGDGNNECFGDTLTYNGKSFKVGSTKAMFTIPGGYGTEFVFTQAGIEQSVIPRLANLRNQLLASNSLYSSKLPVSSPNYGKSNDDPVFGSNATPDQYNGNKDDADGVSYTFSGYATKDTTVLNSAGIPQTVRITTGIDSVWWYNQQIRLWEDAIRKNEREKVLANSSNIDRNISYQAGAGVSYTTSTTRDTTDVFQISLNLAEELALKIGVDIGGSGIEVEQKLKLNYSHTSTTTTTKSTTSTFSYSIDDSDAGDDFTVDVFKSKDGYGPIFKTRGGQTACPYQGETKTKYYRPGSIIDKATIQLEQPRISASPRTVYNVPADAAAVINLSLINDGLEDQIYDLKVLENTNPNGAIIKIDGITPNRSFAVPAQTSISKQIQIEKGPNHIHYDSLAFVFHSQCQYSFGTGNTEDIADTVYVSVQFLPSCTDIEITNPGDQFVLNNDFKDTLPMLLTGYDINYGGLEKIGLQYKPSAQSSWITLSEEWFKDTTDINVRYPNHPSPLVIPTNQSYINYNFDMAQLIDQSYQMRAFTTCEIPGNPDKTQYSNVIGGVADRVNPHPFGTPTPADGVLDPNDDISIQFNEPIEAGALTIDNFQLTGVVNGQELRHDKTVAFDGASTYLEIANGFDFASESFTVEFWAKRNQLGSNQVVISQGNSSNNFFSIGFNAANKVEVNVGNQTYESSFTVLDDSTWHHYSVTYDKPGLNLDIVDRSSSTSQSSTINNFFSSYTGGGKTYIGKSALTGGDYFSGSAHQLRIWNRALSASVISSRLNLNLTGREPGLVGYWPMEEGRGDLAEDVARARHAEFHAQWELSPKSSSAYFDGIDDFALLDSAGTLAATFEMDLTIEFWFKTTGGSPMTFISNGSGRFEANDINRNGWSIELAADNTIHVKNDSVDFEAVSVDFADNQWHHFALVLNRLANTTAYIDGRQQNSISSENFYGFGAPRLALGARYYTNGINEFYDRHFSGYIDEVRIWNSARLRENIELEMFNRMRDNEFGLMVYYPFERYKVELGVASLTPSYKDASASLLDIAPQGGASISSTESPAIALPRPVKNINFSWSVNNDKIVINTNEPNENIENVTLNISVKGVKDLRGNKMQSPKTWIAYINKNQVVWQDVQKNLSKEFNDTLTFSSKVVNNGGEVKTFSISNIPAWLTVSPSSGTIAPLSTETIRFSVKPSVNIGDYSEDIMLSTDFGFNEKLLVKLKVRKTPPNFSFDPSQFAKSMSVIGQLRINGTISVNEEDLLLAYINDSLRGVANLQYVATYDRYMAFLDVYSNHADSIHFKVWNATKGELHDRVTPSLFFVDNNLIGTPTSPQMFDAEDRLSMPITLRKGWNWVSFPLYNKEMKNLHTFLEGLSFEDGDVIKTRGNNAEAAYGGSAYGWVGGLNNEGIINEKSYLIHISNSDTIEYSGFVIDPDTVVINVNQGWNRIGFISTGNLPTATALANFNASEGDLIKGQQSFAYYDQNLGWIGSLQALQPLKGYLLKSSTSTGFTYPRQGLLRVKNQVYQKSLADILPEKFNLNPHDFEASSNMIIEINTCEELLADSNWVLTAFKEDELRGYSDDWIKSAEERNGAYYLTVFGETNEQYSMSLYNLETEEELAVEGNVTFEPSSTQGTPTNPIKMELIVKQNCDQYTDKLSAPVEVLTYSYPNPFTDYLKVVVPDEMGEDCRIEVIDQNGRKLISRSTMGRRQLELTGADLSELSAGVYQLRFIDEQEVITEKIVKIK